MLLPLIQEIHFKNNIKISFSIFTLLIILVIRISKIYKVINWIFFKMLL